MELNRPLKNRFLTLIKNNKVSHSYIIVGNEGSGKADFALYCAKALLCGGEPCGKCKDCKKADMKSHPDIYFISPEGASFKIETVRSITENINIPPNEGKKKIYILEHCENMTVQAQNALLKGFEEPPEYVVFFILTEIKEALLPTVISRASVFTLQPMDKSLLAMELSKKYPKEAPEDIDSAVKLSDGFYGKAVKLLEKGAKEERNIATQLSEYLLDRKSPYMAAKLLNSFKNKRENAVRILSLSLYAVRDTVLYKKGGTELCFLSENAAMKFSKNSTSYIVKIGDELTEAIDALEANGNYTVAVAKLCSSIE